MTTPAPRIELPDRLPAPAEDRAARSRIFEVSSSFPYRPDPFGKRLLDTTVAATLLTLSLPLWPLVAIAIRVEDGGPIFYRQERWGRGGRRIRVRKFRTMVPDSDQRYGIFQAREGDERITRVGHVLRRFGMDELPQLWSIVRGDMSLVGPRPLAVGELVLDRSGRPVQWERTKAFHHRLSVRPGLTSLATVYLPKDAHPREKFKYDQLYVRRCSIWLDLRLILTSMWISVTGRWERRASKV